MAYRPDAFGTQYYLWSDLLVVPEDACLAWFLQRASSAESLRRLNKYVKHAMNLAFMARYIETFISFPPPGGGMIGSPSLCRMISLSVIPSATTANLYDVMDVTPKKKKLA